MWKICDVQETGAVVSFVIAASERFYFFRLPSSAPAFRVSFIVFTNWKYFLHKTRDLSESNGMLITLKKWRTLYENLRKDWRRFLYRKTHTGLHWLGLMFLKWVHETGVGQWVDVFSTIAIKIQHHWFVCDAFSLYRKKENTSNNLSPKENHASNSFNNRNIFFPKNYNLQWNNNYFWISFFPFCHFSL